MKLNIYTDRSTPYGYRTYDVQTQQRPNDRSYSVGIINDLCPTRSCPVKKI